MRGTNVDCFISLVRQSHDCSTKRVYNGDPGLNVYFDRACENWVGDGWVDWVEKKSLNLPCLCFDARQSSFTTNQQAQETENSSLWSLLMKETWTRQVCVAVSHCGFLFSRNHERGQGIQEILKIVDFVEVDDPSLSLLTHSRVTRPQSFVYISTRLACVKIHAKECYCWMRRLFESGVVYAMRRHFCFRQVIIISVPNYIQILYFGSNFLHSQKISKTWTWTSRFYMLHEYWRLQSVLSKESSELETRCSSEYGLTAQLFLQQCALG